MSAGSSPADVTVEVCDGFEQLKCWHGGRLLLEVPLPLGLSTLADEDFVAALRLQIGESAGAACTQQGTLRSQHRTAEEQPLSMSGAAAALPPCTAWQRRPHPRPALTSAAVREHGSYAAARRPSMLRAGPAPALTPTTLSRTSSWSSMDEAWPVLQPSPWRPSRPLQPPQQHPAVKRRSNCSAGILSLTDPITQPQRTSDAALAEALQELEIMEAQGFRRLPRKGDDDDGYHAGAHLLTQEERDAEVARALALANREAGATATMEAMRRMMRSNMEAQAVADEELGTTKDATDRVHSGKHLQRSMLAAGWRPVGGKKHPKWRKEFNGLTLSITHASTPGDRKHIECFAANLQRLERDALQSVRD